MLSRPKSQEIYKKICQVVPGGVNSPVRACKGVEQMPMIVEKASEDTLIDADGHQYIDYCGSWGALIHGHAHPQICEAAERRLWQGTSFGITATIEQKMANKITRLIDSVEKIRFVSSGTEATMSAVRLARGFTGRDLIVKFDGNFHGHADFFLVRAGSGVMEMGHAASSSGIPSSFVSATISLPYNETDSCREFLLAAENRSRIAAVILEPIAANMGVVPPSLEFLKMLRQVTEEIGALLIFDEVITGFRVGLQGAQGLFGIRPDLSCFAKIIGGGFPAAAFGGRANVMDYLAPLGSVYQAGTLSGNPVAMEAGLQALTLLEEAGFYERLQAKTEILTQPLHEYLQKHPELNICLQQQGSMFTLFFGRKSVKTMKEAQQCDGKLFAHFFRTLFAQGIYIPPLQWEAWFISNAHKEENLIKTRDLILDFFKKL